jgi:hypothetical protein
MDTSSYFTTFLKVDDFAEGESTEGTITKVEEGKYGLVLTLDSGSQFSLNATNWRTLSKAHGYESDDWLGKSIKLTRGEATYKGEQVPSLILKPTSPRLSESERKLLAKAEPDIDDDIPFN